MERTFLLEVTALSLCLLLLSIGFYWFILIFILPYFVDPLRPTSNPIIARMLAWRKQIYISCALMVVGEIGILMFSLVLLLLYAVLKRVDFATHDFTNEFVVVVSSNILSIIIIGGMWFFFQMQPVRLFCFACGGYIPSAISWICGRCHHENHRVVFPFLTKCENCAFPPDGIRCDRCGTILWMVEMTPEEQAAYPTDLIATKFSPTETPASTRTVQEQRVIEKQELEHRITIADLEAKLLEKMQRLEILSSKHDKPVERSARVRLSETLSRERENRLAVYEIAETARGEAQETYKSKPDILEMELAVIDDFVQKHGLE